VAAAAYGGFEMKNNYTSANCCDNCKHVARRYDEEFQEIVFCTFGVDARIVARKYGLSKAERETQSHYKCDDWDKETEREAATPLD